MNSFLVLCLLMLRYIVSSYVGTDWIALSAGLVLAGAAAQFFLSRGRRRRWGLPMLCGGALAVLALLYHLSLRGVFSHQQSEEILIFCVLGAEVLCALLGAAIGQIARLARESFLTDGRAGQDL